MDFSARALSADPFGRAICRPKSAGSAAEAKPVAELREHPDGPVTGLPEGVAPVGHPGRLEAERARREHADDPERECGKDRCERDQHGDIVGLPARAASAVRLAVPRPVAPDDAHLLVSVLLEAREQRRDKELEGLIKAQREPEPALRLE